MKILHLLASPYLSGPAELVVQLARAQAHLGHQVQIAVDRKRTSTSAEELAVPAIANLGLLCEAPLELSVKSSPLGVARDIGVLRRLQVDVLHAHFSHDHFVARWAHGRSTRLIRSIHAPRSIRALMPMAHGWTVPSETMGEALGRQPRMVLPALVGEQFVPPVERGALRLELGLPDTALIGMVSTFQPSRRHALGVSAFAQLLKWHPEARLVLVGDGELLPAIRDHVAGLGLGERVIFAGYQSGPAFVRWLGALDEVWLLGLGNDFSARAAAQARACGVRVVAADEGALSRYADAVVDLSADAIAREALGESRRSMELERTHAVARRLLELYDRARR